MICITDDSNDNSYSTDEVLTGKFWIDGKPIYRKVANVDYPTPPYTEAHSLIMSGVDTLVDCNYLIWGYLDSAPNITYQWFNDVRTDDIRSQFQLTNDELHCYSKTTRNDIVFTGAKAIIEYTKTND